MLTTLKSFSRCALHATNGESGKVHEVLFHDNTWDVKYVVAKTGSWMSGRRVLLAPHALGELHPENNSLDVVLTVQQIRDSPVIDSDRPVWLQQLATLHEYHQWPMILASGTLGYSAYIPPDLSEKEKHDLDRMRHESDVHLRSSRQVTGYNLLASDGRCGTISDVTVDTSGWFVPHLVVETGTLLSPRKVLVPTASVRSISWSNRRVATGLAAESVYACPIFH